MGGIVFRFVESPLGDLLLAATDKGVCALHLCGRSRAAAVGELRQRHPGDTVVQGSHPCLEELERELDAYFAGSLRAFRVPLDLHGTSFQRKVWKALRSIPYGRTRSYAEVAERIGHPGAQRAVGGANGENPVAIVVPCHRVVRSDGRIGGYGGGGRRKEFLLNLEGAELGRPGTRGGRALAAV